MTLESCYQILEISANASIDEIKRSYRAKAFLLHPDKNTHPDASQQFVELTEAYEFIISYRSNTYKRYVSPFEQYDKAVKEKREEAKRKAREYAQMRYEEFERTEAAQTINALNIILNHVLLLIACSVLLAIPLVLTYFYEFTGLIGGLLFTLAVSRPIFGYIRQFFKPSDLWLTINQFVETFFFRVVILSVLNIYLIFKIVMNTLIPLEYSLAGFLVIMLCGYFLFFKKRENKSRTFYSFAILPLLINIMFCLNYYASGKPTIEEYQFWNGHNSASGGRSVKNTIIYLEGGFYEDYSGIRLFNSLEEMQGCEHIIYQFEDGLFGIRVMKDYRFTP
jgi:hypothetical protein